MFPFAAQISDSLIFRFCFAGIAVSLVELFAFSCGVNQSESVRLVAVLQNERLRGRHLSRSYHHLARGRRTGNGIEGSVVWARAGQWEGPAQGAGLDLVEAAVGEVLGGHVLREPLPPLQLQL